ncbi:MAG: hypothetical protein U0892_23015 [Pirellulales bacterium]
MDDDSDEVVAYHEAGHVVMAVLLGGRVRHVTIAPDRDDGPRRFGDTEVHWPRRKMSPKQMAVAASHVCLAGPAAEMIYTGEPYHPALVRQWDSDWQSAWSAAADIEVDEKRRLRWLESVTAAVYRQFNADHVWAVIASLADELLAHETLDAREISDILRSG